MIMETIFHFIFSIQLILGIIKAKPNVNPGKIQIKFDEFELGPNSKTQVIEDITESIIPKKNLNKEGFSMTTITFID